MQLAEILFSRMKFTGDSLAGRVAIVTGGAKGIGKQTAVALSMLGGRVAIIDKDEAATTETAAYIRAANSDCLPIIADISHEGELLRAIGTVEKTWQQVDILVNNAAEAFIGSFAEETLEVWDRLFNANLRYPTLALKSLLPGMLERSFGIIANIISLEGLTFSSAYSATKVGMRSLTTSISTEIGNNSGVSIFSFSPGIVDTPLVNTYFYPELARRFGMTMQDIIDGIGGNPGYPGLMPAEDCAAALVHCIVKAHAYNGQVTSPFMPLAQAGVISFEDIGSFGSDKTPAEHEEGMALVNTSLREYLKSAVEINRNLEHRITLRTKELTKANQELQEALAEVKQLSGMLPICSKCKNVRDDQGYWNKIEKYLRTHTNADFSHSICPHCAEKMYGSEPWFKESKQKKSPPTM